jgi:transposase
MANKLSSATIKKRLKALHNLQHLYAIARDRIAKLEEIIHLQDEQLAAQAEQNHLLQQLVDSQAIRIAELETTVFGKKKQPPAGGTPVPQDDLSTTVSKQPRTPASYHRPTPPLSAITNEVAVPLPKICSCGGSFGNMTKHERYEEDIPLPELTPDYQSRLVTKYVIMRGVCLACGKATAGRELGGQVVSLGLHVRLLVCHLISAVGMSYAQVAALLLSLYGLSISKAEIAGILQAQHEKWLPAYNQLQADIRGSPIVHADETSWPIQANNGFGYAWVLADSASPRVCYTLENSRGATHAQALFGENSDQPFRGIRITDDYGAYRSAALPGSQQLCWAHLYRCIRDLRYNDNLPREQLPYVSLWYERFAAIYEDLRLYLSEPYDEVVRETQSHELWQRVERLAAEPVPPEGEPTKLVKLKAQLLRAGQDRLFTCLPNDTPCDNNRAERDLRQLVLKRKRSFGSQTQKGAKALSTILSLCTTTWRMQPQDYFMALAQLG